MMVHLLNTSITVRAVYSPTWPINKTRVAVLQIHQMGVLPVTTVKNTPISEVVPVSVSVLVILLSRYDAGIS